MRKKKHGAERLEACAALMLDYDKENNKLSADALPKDKRICLEIGCGKGAFIRGTAAKNPDTFYIAVERVSDVLVIAAEGAKADGIENVRFVNANASELCEAFEEHSIDRIYLNFSDPWPKKGYAKRRLTHRGFLEKYKRILKSDGSIFFKTDNLDLFDFSLEEFKECGFTLKNVTYDLHNSEFNTDNIMTEYEKNFSEKGFNINRCEAYI